MLQALYLAWNGFSNCGCREIGTALQTNSTLELLDLSNNRVGLEGAKWLAKGLVLNTKLRHLMVFVDSDSLKSLLQLNCFFFNPILSLNFCSSLRWLKVDTFVTMILVSIMQFKMIVLTCICKFIKIYTFKFWIKLLSKIVSYIK